MARDTGEALRPARAGAFVCVYSGELMLASTIAMAICAWFNWWVIFPFCMIAFIVVYLAMGAARQGRLGPVATILWVVGLGYAFLFSLLIWLYTQNPTGMPTTYILGLPPATAVLFYGIWPLPLLLAVAYGLVFDRWIIRREDMDRIEIHSWDKKQVVKESPPAQG